MTIVTSTELNVVDKYRELISASLDGSSTYIRTKETVQSLVDDGLLKDVDKASVIAKTIADMNSSVVSSSMGIALNWASQEKELAFKKLELEKQLDILDKELLIKTAQAKQITNKDLTDQATSLRMNGAMTVVDGTVEALNDTGKIYEDILLTRKQALNADKEATLLTAKTEESHAGTHKLVADTYVNYGAFSGYTITGSGITGISDITPTSLTTLSSLQAVIAKEQAKGFAYNAWASAAAGLGSTIGTALTTETDIFGTVSGQYSDILSDFNTTLKNLKNVTVPSV